MVDVLRLLAHLLLGLFKSSAQVQAENTALWYQLNVPRRGVPRRPRLTAADRLLFVWLLQMFPSIRDAIQIIQPQTVVLTGNSIRADVGGLIR